MNSYYDDSDVTARYGYKVAEDPTVVSEGVCVINDVIYGDAEEIQQFREPMVEVLPLWYRDFWLHDDYMDIICIELATNRLCSIQYSVLPQRLRTGGKSTTAANHWEK